MNNIVLFLDKGLIVSIKWSYNACFIFRNMSDDLEEISYDFGQKLIKIV